MASKCCDSRLARVEANAMTYSSLLNVCAKAGDYQRAEVWLEKMVSTRALPTEAGQAKRAEQRPVLIGDAAVLHSSSAGEQLEVVIQQAYAKTGSFGDVDRLFLAMEAQGIFMDAFCLTVQLSSYARARPRQRERMEDTGRVKGGS
eukprot:Skav232838  [mRNA]  locus=scaffold1834:23931:31392:- [translate_table: standard]